MMKKRMKLGKIIFNVNIVFYILYNTYYGWNSHPVDFTERTFDIITKITFWISVFLYFSPLLDIYKVLVDRLDRKVEEQEEKEKNIRNWK